MEMRYIKAVGQTIVVTHLSFFFARDTQKFAPNHIAIICRQIHVEGESYSIYIFWVRSGRTLHDARLTLTLLCCLPRLN